jgi:hypothetical protein
MGENKKKDQGVNVIKLHYMYVWKYNNETPIYN